MTHIFDRLTLKNGLTILILVAIAMILFTGTGRAQTKATFTPRISISETYDDNIDLDPEDEESDWITVLSPGFLLELDSQKTQLDLDYEAGFSFYAKDSSRDTTRHQARISWDQLLAEHLSLNLNNTFTRSEDPIREEDGRVEDISNRRDVEYRNTGEASMSWQFGPEDIVALGYRNRLLNSDSDQTEDSRANEGFLNLDTWFVQQFGIGLTSSFGRWQFQQPGGFTGIPTDDFDRYQATVAMNYRWQPSRRVYVRYYITYQDFKGTETDADNDDFVVHQPTLGFSTDLGPQSDLGAEFGYFRQDLDGDRKGEDGFVLNASFNTRGQRTTFGILTDSGDNLDYGTSNNEGFSKYSDSSANVRYQLTENLNAFATARYRWENFTETNRKDHTYGGRVGLNYTFRSWLTVTFEGGHLRRDSNENDQEFTDNRVSLRITTLYPIPFGD